MHFFDAFFMFDCEIKSRFPWLKSFHKEYFDDRPIFNHEHKLILS